MDFQKRKLTDLTPAEYNPRKALKAGDPGIYTDRAQHRRIRVCRPDNNKPRQHHHRWTPAGNGSCET